jgi:hypothetical protein
MVSIGMWDASFFNLFCYVRGEHYNNAFEVTARKDESVATLKETIKEKKRPNFDHIPADSLVLWKVSVPCDQNLKKNVNDLHLLDYELPQSPVAHPDDQIQSLPPDHKMSEVFLVPPIEKHVHIIVMAPPSRSTIQEADLVEKGDIITTLVRASKFLPLVPIRFSPDIVQGTRQPSRKLGMQIPRQNPRNTEFINDIRLFMMVVTIGTIQRT